MATHTWVDLQISEAARLADLSGIVWDLRRARQFAEMLRAEFGTQKPNWNIVEPLSIAATVTYSRPFLGGVRQRLGEDDLEILAPEQRAAHDHLAIVRSMPLEEVLRGGQKAFVVDSAIQVAERRKR